MLYIRKERFAPFKMSVKYASMSLILICLLHVVYEPVIVIQSRNFIRIYNEPKELFKVIFKLKKFAAKLTENVINICEHKCFG